MIPFLRLGRRALLCVALSPFVLRAQHEGHNMPMPTERPMVRFGADVPMNRFASGTAWIPDAVSLPSQSWMSGDWHLMAHGYAFLQYDRQSGPRGGDQVGSLNWGMLMASRPLGRGALQLRSMLSIDAATVGGEGYPLLLQTGESYNGRTIHDRQHPHDAFMELAALYDHPLSQTLALEFYVAPVGEPALGPPAFMHRPSSVDDPSAPLGHHWQDATHVSFGVATVGILGHRWKLEASAFNGREPDQHRWNFDFAPLRSFSSRLTLNPSDHWSLSAGYGFIDGTTPSGSGHELHRTLVSAQYGKALSPERQFAATVIWGANSPADHGSLAQSMLVEAEIADEERGSIFARAELVQKSAEELVLTGALAADPERTFDVGTISLGGVRTVARTERTTLGLGLRFSLNLVPESLASTYGGRTSGGLVLFARLRPRRSAPMVHSR